MSPDTQNVWIVTVDGQRLVGFPPTAKPLAEAEAAMQRKILQESAGEKRYAVEVKQVLLG